MTWTLLATVLGASLAGSLHCAGMCGGFVAFWAGADAGAGRLRAHVAYSLGRLLTYAGFGLAAGLVGAALDLAGELAGLRRAAALTAGALMTTWGLFALGSALGWRIPSLRLPAGLTRLARRAHAAAVRRPPVARAFLVGLATTLLPCGWLHAFTITAAGTAEPLAGLSVMVAFWAGTLPLLTAMGAGLQALAAPLRRHVPVASASLILVIGLIWLVNRAALPIPDEPGAAPPACHGPR